MGTAFLQNKQQNQYFPHWGRWKVFDGRSGPLSVSTVGSKERGTQAAGPLSASIQRFDYIQLTDIYGAPSTCQTLLGKEGREGRMRGPGAGRSEGTEDRCVESYGGCVSRPERTSV